jgi:transposase
LDLPENLAECHALILAQSEQLMSQEAKLDQLGSQVLASLVKISELEARLNKNSGNSHKPPSSDGYGKKPVQKAAFGRKKGRKSGGQPGHSGHTLEMVSDPSEIEKHLPSHCQCGSPLSDMESRVLESRQVFDLPEPVLKVVEHQKHGCACGNCGRWSEGTFPNEVTASVQYGVNVKALAVLLNVFFKLPLNKIQALFGDLYGYAINPATILAAGRQCYEKLAESEEVIKKSLLDSLVAHVDETGLRVLGSLHWLHVCSTKLFTYLFIHAKRGKEALLDTPSLLPDFKGWAIHDCWKSYFNELFSFRDGLCGAHILRELQALEEKEIQWASWFRRYLMSLYKMSNQGKGVLDQAQQQKALLLFEHIWNTADQIEPLPQKNPAKRGRPKATKGRNLLIRLKEHQDALLAFAFFEEVPFTNNQAERDLRPAKTKQKVAGSFRTFEGAQRFARIHAFVSTTRKHKLNVFNQLKLAISGKKTFLTQQRA